MTEEEAKNVLKKYGFETDFVEAFLVIANAQANKEKTVSKQEDSDDNVFKEVTETLKEFGIPANIRGYRYLREAIILVMSNQEMLEKITISLYPTIAEKFGSTTYKVERAIRHAIAVAFEKGNTNVFKKYFGNSVDFSDKKPNNSYFIAGVADKLLLQQK